MSNCRGMWIALRGGLVGMIFVITNTVFAGALDNIVSIPTSSNVPAGRSYTFPLSWKVTSTANTGAITPVDLSFVLATNDTRVVIRDPALNILGYGVATMISRAVFVPALTTIDTIVTDSITVPAYVIDKALASGFATITYTRTFTGNLTQLDASGTVQITSSGSGFTIARTNLSFDDGNLTRSVMTNAMLKASLEMEVVGTGLFRGIWEVSESPTGNNSLYRALHTESHYLLADKRIVFHSPPLPTQRQGVHKLRFRMLQPVEAVSDAIQYIVGGATGKESLANGSLTIITPANRSRVPVSSPFKWIAVTGAEYYQLDFFSLKIPANYDIRTTAQSGNYISQGAIEQHVSGILLKGKNLETTITRLAGTQLKQGIPYVWQITALDGSGKVLAVSPYRLIQFD